MTFQKEHDAPHSNIKITTTRTHHTMSANVSNVVTEVFRMAVLVTDRTDITDYEIDESVFGNAGPSSGDDAGGHSDSDASYTSRSFLEEVDGARDEDEAGFSSDAEHSQSFGPCDMCGATGPSGRKCEVGSNCNSDAGGYHA